MRGESDVAGDVTINSHIAAAITDILNTYPFTWDLATANLTLAGGTANMPADFNPKWGLPDARIAGSSVGSDQVFTPVPIKDRNSYASTSYPCWLTYDVTNKVYVFNTNVQTGTVTIFYQFFPATLSADNDVLLIPDGEAVAYLAASKMFIGDERNVELKTQYEMESNQRVKSLYQADLMFGAPDKELNIVGSNPQLNQGGYQTDFRTAIR